MKDKFKIMSEVCGHYPDLLAGALLNEAVITPFECGKIMQTYLEQGCEEMKKWQSPTPPEGKTDFQIAWELSMSKEKPFFVDTFRTLLNKYDKEEISLSKFVEELNVSSVKWAAIVSAGKDIEIGHLGLKIIVKEEMIKSQSQTIAELKEAGHKLLSTIPVENGNVYLDGFKEAVYNFKQALNK